ncbi:MAG: hypothetical protein EOO90_21465 [Pedobacter sp.]|nr:MAG: hypothetical protein EOO90_21465 [Pedobacter sp.]
MAQEKHSEIKNKRHAEVQINEDQRNSPTRSRKNYITAKKKATKSLKSRNDTVEVMYHAVLKRVTALYSSLPKNEDRVIVEMDMKLHPLDGEQMHAFLTPHYLLFLECDHFNHYRVEYCFHQCPLEAEIKAIMEEFLINSYSTEIRKMPDYSTYFKNVLQCQPERFIRVL